MNFCVIVPAYGEERRIGPVVGGIRSYCEHVVVVDDGSPDCTGAAAGEAGAVVLRHETNQGKGVALETGFRYAREQGFEFLITMDADGQHDPADIPAFISVYAETGVPVIIGNRMANPVGMPWVRKMTNYYTSWLLSRAMGQRVPDTQNGYRLYRCDVLDGCAVQSPRFAAESEILLSLAERGVRIGSAPIRVIYGEEKSKINPIKDTVRFFRMVRAFRKRSRSGG